MFIVAEMPGNKKPGDGSHEGGASRSSTLESQLQQAWLQSQIPKVQRRSVTGSLSDRVFGEKPSCSQSSAELPLNAVSGRAGDGSDVEKTYFHKSRPESVPSEFLRRFATPQLETISEKTDVPVPRSNSAPLPDSRNTSTVSDGFSHSTSASTLFTSSDELNSIDSHHSMGGGVFDSVDFDGIGCGSVDLAGQTEPLALFLDDILLNEELEEEKCLVQQTSAYQAMEKEIADLLAPDSAVDGACDSDGVDEYDRFWTNVDFTSTEESSEYKAMAKEIADLLSPEPTIIDDGGSEVLNDKSNTSTEFVPSEEDMALMMMEGYTSMLSKHIKDVSTCSIVDYRTWITESDEIPIVESCRSYFEASSLDTSASTSMFDFNLILRGTGRLNLSRESALAPLPGTSMTELLYRYGRTLTLV